VLAAAKVAFGSLFRGFGHRSSSFGRPIVFANRYSNTGIVRVALGAPGRTSTTSSTLGSSTKDPPVAGHEWEHACHGSFCSPSVSKFCSGKRSAKISLRTSRSVWVDLRGDRKVEAGLRVEERALSCVATPAWPSDG